MRYLIVSDIHGNRFGLEAVLSAAAGHYDKLICLGDVVGYGAHPNECCELLREHEAFSLSGNHDAAALGLLDTSWFNPVALAAIKWTRRQLTEENQQWLQSLPAQCEWSEEDFQAVHGSLREPWEEYITDQYIAEATIQLMSCRLCFYGHTHVAICYREAKKSRWSFGGNVKWKSMPNGGSIDLTIEGTYLVNPGSCGQPRDGNPQARYALFDTEKQSIVVEAIDYDWNAARAAIIDAGLPALLGDRLLQGR
jgi:predicted phosphodiesterase